MSQKTNKPKTEKNIVYRPLHALAWLATAENSVAKVVGA
jgi:hypothetical protein